MMNTTRFNEIKARQKQILKSLGDDILILPTAPPPVGVGNFRQESHFFYLTGFPQTGAVAVIDPTRDHEAVSLFVKEKNRQEEVWQGFTIGVKATRNTYPVDKAYDVRQLEAKLKDRLKGRTVYYKSVHNHPQNATLDNLLSAQDCQIKNTGAPFDRLVELRIIKSPGELEQMREAIRITGEAHHACMRAAGRHRFEYQFEAEFAYCCTMQGARQFGFSTIVAAGAHGTCQHYLDNDGPVGDDDLVLIDAGAAWHHYTADLTRTFPASGTFSPIQRDLYAVVLSSQKAGVDAVAPGITLHELHAIAARRLIDGLKALSILHGSTEEIIEKSAYKDFWPGGLAHSLGLDVHDVTPPAYRGPDAEKGLEPGMVITVEPGFYAQDFNHQIPERFKHIGIRIEDDVLVTEDGHENLSAETVKEIKDVEQMTASGPT